MRSPEVLTRPRSSAQGSQTFGFPPYAIVGRDDHFDWLSYKFAKASTHSHCDRVVGVTVSDTIVGAALSRRPAVYTPQARP